MDIELILAAIQREREADVVRLDRVRRAKPDRATLGAGACVMARPHPLRRAMHALSAAFARPAPGL